MVRFFKRLSLSILMFAVATSANAAVVSGLSLTLDKNESSYSAAIGITADIIGLGTQSLYAPAIHLDPTSGNLNVDIAWSSLGEFESINFNSESALIPGLSFNYNLPTLPVVGSLGSLSGTFSVVTIDDFDSALSPATVISPIGASGGTWDAALGTYSTTWAPTTLTGTGLLSFINFSASFGTYDHSNPAPFSMGSVVVGPDIAGFSEVTVTIPYSYEAFLIGPYSVIPGVVDNVGVTLLVGGQLVYHGLVESSAVVPELGSVALLGASTVMATAVLFVRRRRAA